MIILNLVYFAYYANTLPHYGTRKKMIEIFNEVMIHISILHLMLFTDFIQNQILKFYIGYFLIGCLLFVLVINIIFLVHNNIYRL